LDLQELFTTHGNHVAIILLLIGAPTPYLRADPRVIIKLASDKSNVHYVDIDTSHFSGNEAPFSSVHALKGDTSNLTDKDKRWEEILPKVELGPNSRHIFEVGTKGKEGVWSALMVRMIPDGGMVCPLTIYR
jgi:allantoicase